ncbi:MAG: hypothetical protein ACFNUN_09280, partial [Aggregatibacter sp.]|uniref:hypothetical protein n=1 Tax=Aggregatibacter sp. TaxID=1872413 RepID=UPI0036095391
QAEDLGNFSGAFNIFTTPEGTDYNTDRREKTAQIHHNGRIWSKRYGWLDEQFAPANDTHKKSRCHNHWFPSHYAGAEVVDLPVNDAGGIRITWMGVKLPNYQPPYVDIYLPMAYSGFAKATVSDDGGATFSYGTEMIGNNIVAAASVRLCVETSTKTTYARCKSAVAFAWLCVETHHF